ncbi:MAG: 50S ribosomal protein L9 [Verrucomicrobiales bacterium]|nr:50S ribosomal protein L9 [Verrucomicrobiales bacterium]
MATTEVILREKVDGLGAESDIVKVKRGFARNFLLPQGKAFEATRGNLRHIEHLKEVRKAREAEELKDAERTAEKLRKLRLNIELSIGQGGKAFGSITTTDIAALIKEKSKSLDIDRHQIQLDKPIKSLGTYEIPVKVHATHPASISLRVIAPEKEKQDDKDSDS